MTLANPHDALDYLARAETLLVCMDFDGTICPLGTDAYAVVPDPRAIAALETLAALPGTEVASLSGRHLEGLRTVCPLGPPVTLVGSHGAEPASGGPELTPEDQEYLDGIQRELEKLTRDHPGAFVEVKPYQRVLHVVKLAATEPDTAAALIHDALQLPTHGRPVTPGHNILEFSAVDITKGSWLAAEKTRYAATLFAGDDVTDETALAALETTRPHPSTQTHTATTAHSNENTPTDVGIKVHHSTTGSAGVPDTAAKYGLGSVAEVADFLTALAEARQSVQG